MCIPMMYRTLCLVLFLMTVEVASAQPTTRWTSTFDACTEAAAVSQTTDGHLVAIGNAKDGQGRSTAICLIKLTVQGDLIWMRQVVPRDTLTFFSATSLTPASDGGMVVVGTIRIEPEASNAGLLMKIDADGQVSWRRTYAEDEIALHGVTADPEGGYFMAGRTMSYLAPGINGYLARTDTAGDLLWSRIIRRDGDDSERLFNLVPVSEGGALAVGVSYETMHGNIMSEEYTVAVRIGAGGETSWLRTLGTFPLTTSFIGNRADVVSRSNGGFVVISNRGHYEEPDIAFEAFLVRIDAQGHVLWEDSFSMLGDTSQDTTLATSAAPGPEDGFVIAGFATRMVDEASNRDGFLARFDADGVLDWKRFIGRDDRAERVDDVAALSRGRYVVVGTQDSCNPVGCDVMYVALLGTDTDNAEEPAPPAAELSLAAIYPNPFTSSTTTTISYSLSSPESVVLRVFDQLGREVAVLARGRRPAGRHTTTFEAANLPSGIYFIRLEARGNTETQSVMVLR